MSKASITTFSIALLIIGLIVGGFVGYYAGMGTAPVKTIATIFTKTMTVTVTSTIPISVTTTPTSMTITTPAEKIRIAVIYVTPIEEPWNMALHMAMKWAEEELGVEYVYIEKVHESDVERVIREYIAEGYKIIFPHSWGYHTVTYRLAKEFPDVIFCQGSGPVDINWPPNVLLYDYWIQEAAYLAGMTAGLLTKTNKIGVVTAYPVPDVNRLVNAFIKGAKDVNPDIEPHIIFLETWFDPEKVKEATMALIERECDVIYSERYGAEKAAEEYFEKTGKRIFIIGNIVNQNDIAPDVVIGSVVWDLRPFIKYVVDMLIKGEVKGGIINWGMKEGWAKFELNEKLIKEGVITTDILEKIKEAKDKILSGELKVPIMEEDPRKIWLK